MKVLILGLGLHGGGFAAATYFRDRGDTVYVTDTAEREKFSTIPDILEEKGIKCFFGPQSKEQIQWADIVIKNPAIPATSPLLTYAKQIESDISMLFKHPDIAKIKIICVTGTKGKTTTVSALTEALTHLGKDCYLCGNVGISAFFALKEIEKRKAEKRALFDYLIIELSSWQIHDAYISLQGKWPKMEMVILTNIYLDHQNTYSSLYTYTNDKLQLFTAPCNYRLVPTNKRSLFKKSLNISKLPITTFPSLFNPFKKYKTQLIPSYDALRLLKVSKAYAIHLLNNYKGTPHRCEQIALKNDIMYVNDSAATIAEAVNFSTSNIKPLSFHLICGGTDKNLPPEKMSKSLKDASSIVLLDGSFTRHKLIPLIEKLKLSYLGPYKTMSDAFMLANALAIAKRNSTKQTQVVILSPGAASFELFTNEFARGDAFKKEVVDYISGSDDTE